ncbi:hypothetical protein [Shewanella youngdeokensis]|uniref:Molecular chaperone n=1 Tax=Shewanella youngdeokensis TaxID=2999068 RepID=A0ABZ0K2G0_9GAMM|nr:hypothetical protein RGE70_07875 [Shewanella sp. DAU334]
MKKFFVCGFAALLSFQSFANLLVNPTRVELDNLKNRSAVFTLMNRSENTARYNIYFEDKEMLDSGEFISLDNDRALFSLSDYVRYSPRRLNIEPEQAVKVRLAARLPKSIEKGEYRSYIVFHQIPLAPVKSETDADASEPFSLSISAYLKVSVPVILRVGELDTNLRILDTNIDAGQHAIQVTIGRDGERSSYGDVEIVDAATGRIVGGSKNVAIYTELEQRTFSVPITEQLAANTQLIVRYTENDKLNKAKTVEVGIAL